MQSAADHLYHLHGFGQPRGGQSQVERHGDDGAAGQGTQGGSEAAVGEDGRRCSANSASEWDLSAFRLLSRFRVPGAARSAELRPDIVLEDLDLGLDGDNGFDVAVALLTASPRSSS
ncbi:hypothetical protein ACYF6T_07715 [Streptomyces sp. 7R007]